jgi:hypothetical protein
MSTKLEKDSRESGFISCRQISITGPIQPKIRNSGIGLVLVLDDFAECRKNPRILLQLFCSVWPRPDSSRTTTSTTNGISPFSCNLTLRTYTPVERCSARTSQAGTNPARTRHPGLQHRKSRLCGLSSASGLQAISCYLRCKFWGSV